MNDFSKIRKEYLKYVEKNGEPDLVSVSVHFNDSPESDTFEDMIALSADTLPDEYEDRVIWHANDIENVLDMFKESPACDFTVTHVYDFYKLSDL